MGIEERDAERSRQVLETLQATLSVDAQHFLAQLTDECQFLVLDQMWQIAHCAAESRDYYEGYAMGSVRYAFKAGHLTQAGYNMLAIEIYNLRRSLDVFSDS